MITVNELKSKLAEDDVFLQVALPSCDLIPEHFHVTEVGKVQKSFVDCGGTCRESIYCLLQTWTANDVDHRLKSSKLLKIMNLAEKVLGSDDLPVEIEYGVDAAVQYVLYKIRKTNQGLVLVLKSKKTDCLAPDKCGIKGCC
jgi:hypothetical protein